MRVEYEGSLSLLESRGHSLSNNVLQGRNPSLSFYTRTVQWLRRIWTWVWTWVWALTLLAQTWFKSSWEGERCQRTTSSASKGKEPPPACSCIPSNQALLHSVVLAERFLQRLSLQPVPHILVLPVLSPFFHCWRLSYHTTAATGRFCSLSLPCKKTSSLCAEDYLLLLALKIIAQQQIQFLTLIYIS